MNINSYTGVKREERDRDKKTQEMVVGEKKDLVVDMEGGKGENLGK